MSCSIRCPHCLDLRPWMITPRWPAAWRKASLAANETSRVLVEPGQPGQPGHECDPSRAEVAAGLGWTRISRGVMVPLIHLVVASSEKCLRYAPRGLAAATWRPRVRIRRQRRTARQKRAAQKRSRQGGGAGRARAKSHYRRACHPLLRAICFVLFRPPFFLAATPSLFCARPTGVMRPDLFSLFFVFVCSEAYFFGV